MTVKRVDPAGAGLRGSLRVPGDKSIAHRAMIVGALAEGRSTIRGVPGGADVRSTRGAVATLGASVQDQGSVVEVDGMGFDLGTGRQVDIDCGNSGTTMRMVAGVVAARSGVVTLRGDASLSRRPMERVARPLRQMGATIETTDGHAPMVVRGTELRPMRWVPEVASAQVKSAIVFAALRTPGTTIVADPDRSRDHTERLLAHLGAAIERVGDEVIVRGNEPLRRGDLEIPGDPSSAAFWVVVASILPGSQVTIRDVCVNETRVGFLEVLRRMGARIALVNRRERCGEPWADLEVQAAPLRGTTVDPREIPACIDELPILAVAAAAADGETRVAGAAELRAKESDRLDALRQLRALGVDIDVVRDGFVVRGRVETPLEGGEGAARGDHRIAMALSIAALVSRRGVTLDDADVVAVSYPTFFADLESLLGRSA